MDKTAENVARELLVMQDFFMNKFTEAVKDNARAVCELLLCMITDVGLVSRSLRKHLDGANKDTLAILDTYIAGATEDYDKFAAEHRDAQCDIIKQAEKIINDKKGE